MIFSHKHRPDAIAVQERVPGPFQPTSTVVLFRCPCGALHTQQLAGKWTLAQVRGEVGAKPSVNRSGTELAASAS